MQQVMWKNYEIGNWRSVKYVIGKVYEIANCVNLREWVANSRNV